MLLQDWCYILTKEIILGPESSGRQQPQNNSSEAIIHGCNIEESDVSRGKTSSNNRHTKRAIILHEMQRKLKQMSWKTVDKTHILKSTTESIIHFLGERIISAE
ncbi:MAG: hypothetical protein QF408_08790 [Pirellulales bacterium]|jgi:hypothetical protein|nr:hypothetical protein [Pirellulales bacterium]